MRGLDEGLDWFTPHVGAEWDESKHPRGKTTEESTGGSFAPKQVDTGQFKNWFGASKVVDENGKPLVVYHASRANIEKFDPERLGSGSDHPSAHLGFFFFADPQAASEWHKRHVSFTDRDKTPYSKGANVSPVFLKIENPYEMTAADFVEELDFWQGMKNQRPGYGAPGGSNYERSAEHFRKFREELQSLGYDGIRIKGGANAKNLRTYPELDADNWIAFHPTQIKSAIGNRGTFDPNDPNVIASRKFDPSKHPRVPKGSGDPSGEFTTTEFDDSDQVEEETSHPGGVNPSQLINPKTGHPFERTHAGQIFERLLDAKASALLLKYFGDTNLERTSGPGNPTHPIDYRTRRWGIEVKTIMSTVRHKKTGIKGRELARKLDYVQMRKLKPGMVLQVVDQETKTVTMYGAKTIGSRRVGGLEKIGTYRYRANDLRVAAAIDETDKSFVAEDGDLVIEFDESGEPFMYIQGGQPRVAAGTWDESKHRRGKTSPESTPGSFAPDDELGGPITEEELNKHKRMQEAVAGLVPEYTYKSIYTAPDQMFFNADEDVRGFVAGNGAVAVGLTGEIHDSYLEDYPNIETPEWMSDHDGIRFFVTGNEIGIELDNRESPNQLRNATELIKRAREVMPQQDWQVYIDARSKGGGGALRGRDIFNVKDQPSDNQTFKGQAHHALLFLRDLTGYQEPTYDFEKARRENARWRRIKKGNFPPRRRGGPRPKVSVTFEEFKAAVFDPAKHPRGKTTPESRGGSFAPRVSQAAYAAIEEDEANIFSAPIEFGVARNAEGDLIFKKAGARDHIPFSEEELAQVRGTIFTHNHPSGMTLSPDDIYFACRTRLLEVRAIGSNGHLYTMRPQSGRRWPMKSVMMASYAKHHEAVTKELGEMVRFGDLTPAEAGEQFWDYVHESVASDWGLEYKHVKPKKVPGA